MAIDGYPLASVDLAVRRLIRGEFEDVDRRFLPTPAQVSNAVAYCAKVLEPPPKRLALPPPGSEALTDDEVARRQALAAKARERFGIKSTQGEAVVDRDAIPEAKRAELDRAVQAVADRIKAEGLPKLSPHIAEDARRKLEAAQRGAAELAEIERAAEERRLKMVGSTAVPSPAEQYDEWERRTPSHLTRNEEKAA